MAKRCRECSKRAYDSATVVHACLSVSRTLGRPVTQYACPADPTVFHIRPVKRKKLVTP